MCFCCTMKWISYMYTYIPSLLDLSSTPLPHPTHLGCHRAPSWPPCAIYSRFPLAICFTHGSVFMSHLISWASLVVQWLKIRLPMQGAWVWALVWEDPMCCGASKPVSHNYWASVPQVLEPVCRNSWSLCTATTEAHMPRACAPQQEKPPQWEACALQQRVAPACHN